MDYLKTFNKSPRLWDAFWLILFVVIISFPPYLFHHEVIYLDQGLYLPGINAIFDGKIPQKDFIFYRGPFEIYTPALIMKIFGNNMIWLPVFFYVGTMVNIILAILIAREFYRTRLFFYLMVPVFLARTFPRVSFYYWGGMRYALAMAGVFLTIKFLKTRKVFWIWASGLTTAAGFFTTIESGVSAACAILAGLLTAWLFRIIDGSLLAHALKWYGAGMALVAVPFLGYLTINNALIPFVDATIFFPTRMTSTFLDIGTHIPASFGHFLISLLPNSDYFKVLTPVYFFIIFIAYMYLRVKNRRYNAELTSLVMVGVYALILYIASFRAIWGHHFEMALQPEKILYFFLIEEAYFWLMKKRERWSIVLSGYKRKAVLFFVSSFIAGLVMSSLGYAFARFNKRFPAYNLLYNKLAGKPVKDYSLLSGQDKKMLTIDRAKGMVVPAWQAEDIEETVKFIQQHTYAGEAVLTYPELGVFNFWFDRPFVGRFPIATLSWVSEEWHREYLNDIRKANPRYAIMTNLGHQTFPSQLYFKFPGNVVKFREITNYILKNYRPIKKLNSISIYERIQKQ